MIYKKVKFVKKQISHNRGVTWEDTEPLEYCDPIVVGVYPSLAACEDTDCDLEKYEYQLTEVRPEDLPKFCTETNFCNVDSKPDECVTWHFPSGIIKHVLFSDYTGRVTHGGYGGSIGRHNYTYEVYNDGIMDMVTVDIGDYYDYEAVHGDYTSGATGASIDGQEVIFHGNDGCYCPADAVWRCFTMDYCVAIDEFMPWVGDTIKVLYKTHYTREHCSEEWQFDDDFGIQFISIGEKWEKSYDYTSISWKWVQKVATSVDSAGTLTWVDGPEPPYYEEIPHPNGATGIECTTGGAYAISVNFTQNYYGYVTSFLVQGNAIGTYSSYNSYTREYEPHNFTSPITERLDNGGWLVLGGTGRKSGGGSNPPVKLVADTGAIYRAGYNGDVLLPMLYNNEQVLVNPSGVIFKPVEGIFRNNSTFFETF